MLGPFATASRRTPHYHSPGVASVASHAARTPMSTTTTTTTTTTRGRGDRYGPVEWAQKTAAEQACYKTLDAFFFIEEDLNVRMRAIGRVSTSMRFRAEIRQAATREQRRRASKATHPTHSADGDNETNWP